MFIVKLQTIFVGSRLKQYKMLVIKMIRLTLFGLNPINVLQMAYIMYFILFQCITMIDSEKIYDFRDFLEKLWFSLF